MTMKGWIALIAAIITIMLFIQHYYPRVYSKLVSSFFDFFKIPKIEMPKIESLRKKYNITSISSQFEKKPRHVLTDTERACRLLFRLNKTRIRYKDMSCFSAESYDCICIQPIQ